MRADWRVRAVAAASMVVLGIAIQQTLVLAWSDILQRQGDVASIRKAVELSPMDAHARVLQAAVFAAVNPAGKEEADALGKAIELNPRDAEAWMALGIKAETAGDNAAAEKFFLGAAKADHTFKPAWTLANFYVRSGQMDQFWHWIRVGMELVEPRNKEALTFDPKPIFDLCWNVTNDSALILERAIPKKPKILTSYVIYLDREGRVDAALEAARPLFGTATEAEAVMLKDLCENLVAKRQASNAIEVWNTLSLRKLIALAPLDPAQGISLANADLKTAPEPMGFDWKFPRPGGVYETYSAAGPVERLDMDGDEPENAAFIIKFIPLIAARHYRFDYRYDTSGIAGPETGLNWAIGDFAVSGIQAHEEAGKEPGHAGFEFAVPARIDMTVLSLRYSRVPGTIHPKGSFKLYGATLQLLP